MKINKIYQGDSLETIKTFPDESVDCVITSPPYWGLRDYGTAKWKGGDENCDHTIPKGEFDPKNPESGSHIARFNRENCYKCGAKRIDNQIGLEKTPEEYVAKMVELFREVRRVLKKEAILEQYAILSNILPKENKIKVYFATAYNKFGENKPWRQERVRQFFADDELLIGKDFWNFICKSDKGYEWVLEAYRDSAHLIKEALEAIKRTYLG